MLTLDNLQKRGQPLVNICYLCKHEGKSINQLLLHSFKVCFPYLGGGVDDPFFGEDSVLKLARLLSWEQKEKGVERYSTKHFSNNLEGTKSKSF